MLSSLRFSFIKSARGSLTGRILLPTGLLPLALLGVLLLAASLTASAQTYNPNGVTVAGGNGQGSQANQLNRPIGVAVDGSGAVYVADYFNHRIQKWAIGASQGVTVAGGNGAGQAPNQLNFPQGVAVDGAGAVYVADQNNHRIQKWTVGASQGVTVAGGNGYGSQANQLSSPFGVAVDGAGAVYVGDTDNHRIQKWAVGASQGVTIAGGNGAGQAPNQIEKPQGVAVDGAGAVYVVDIGNHRIQKWAIGASQGVTVAGGNGAGQGSNQLSSPFGVAVDGAGAVYVGDTSNDRIQKWAVGASQGVTVAGGNGFGSNANQLDLPFGVALDGLGAVYVADLGNHRIQKFSVCSLVSITAQPVAALSVCVGTPLSVPVSTSGTIMGYQWYKDGSVVSGQTSATLSLPNTTTSSTGSYSVVVTGGCNSVTSTAFNLTVNPLPGVSITPATTAICAGQTATLTAQGANTYSWSTGQTTPSISVSANGSYSVTGTNTSGCTATASASVTVRPTPPAPAITTQSGQSGQLYPGGQSSVTVPQYSGTVTLLISGCMGTLNWQGPNGSSGTSTSIPVATSATGTFVYQATCRLDACPSAVGSATVVVQSGALMMVAPLYDCQTRQLTLRTTGGNGQPIEYHIASVTTGWETVGSTFMVQDKHIGKSLKLRARQRSSTGGGYVEVETSFTPTACGSARRGVNDEPEAPLSVVVLGNPVTGQAVSVEVRGAQGQPLRLQLTNLQGWVVSEQAIERAGSVEQHTLSLGSQSPGMLLLRVSTPTQSRTVKVLKAE